MPSLNSQNPQQSRPMVTAVQMNSQQDIDSNLINATNAIKTAKQQGASLVVLPENVASMGKQRQTAKRFDELAERFSVIAREQEVHLVAGTLPCPYRPDGSRVDNNKLRQASLLFAPDGTQIARYDKIHLFRALVNDSHGSYDEGLTFEAGTQLTVAPIELAGGNYQLGMMVCFDLRFPKMAQSLRQMGADILTAPSAFTYQTGKANWSLLLQARALDSQCLLIGAGQGGKHYYHHGTGDKATQQTVRETWGHTGIAGCDGSMLALFDNHLLGDLPSDPCNLLEGLVEGGVADNAGYKLISATFDNDFQHTQRNHLPTFNCHRLV